MANQGLINRTEGKTSWIDRISWDTIWKGMAISAGIVTIPRIPGIIDRVTGIPDRMMENGYELRARRRRREGGFSVEFGRGCFLNDSDDEVVVEEDDDE